jgi:hypothetical protein
LVDAAAPTRRLAAMFGLESLHGMIATLLASRHEIDFDQWITRGPDVLVERWRRFHAEHILPAQRGIAESGRQHALGCPVPRLSPGMQRRRDALVRSADIGKAVPRGKSYQIRGPPEEAAASRFGPAKNTTTVSRRRQRAARRD